jgi:hypothetical protein
MAPHGRNQEAPARLEPRRITTAPSSIGHRNAVPESAIPHALVSHFVPLSEQHFADEHAIDRTSIRLVNIRYSA